MNIVKKSVVIYSILLACVIAYWLIGVIHLEEVKGKSKFAFTVVEISDYYHQGNVNGKEVTYFINDRKYVGHCSSTECKQSKIGDRFLIKVFDDDPEVFEIIFDFSVKKGVISPRGGWKTMPSSDIRSM